MKSKVDALIELLQATISDWSNVECITVDPRSEIFAYDPYFALVIDVYYRGKIPSARTRKNAFGDPGDFETAASQGKDRFFLEEVPIRVEYKGIKGVDALVTNPLRHLVVLKNTGTYLFYRLSRNRIVFDKTGWIGKTRKKLDEFPKQAWDALYDSFTSKMEHYLSDLGGACFSEDQYFLFVSQTGFMSYAAASLFMANRRFEPSHREIEAQLKDLPSMPEGFIALWKLLLQNERELTGTKRFELSRAMAKSVLSIRLP
ncbi:MAG: DUF4037 domain-containing protein [Spirochaetaceae bacterium]|nr:DUF4037 domain-containing protein [Spirochaetaceae bacterium]